MHNRALPLSQAGATLHLLLAGGLIKHHSTKQLLLAAHACTQGARVAHRLQSSTRLWKFGGSDCMPVGRSVAKGVSRPDWAGFDEPVGPSPRPEQSQGTAAPEETNLCG